ncbi:DUF3793 family protein [Clostridium algidicarnis]|uniref:DUF3793 family protein n=1 Tax=Clostridium algidicarnis TaxID=37659 RepID=UPI001C0B79F6|nr:DUF3793 family protein [Clostridium algidicarnis]MBU3196174.1 DUF3793 family protein [Clostridium algidicarnis]MBU3228865.1 DUF3793 family protein [Clostridium algidicarnis]MBU3252417.1 DUF3793 family protein [Clostridium algidicarnis]
MIKYITYSYLNKIEKFQDNDYIKAKIYYYIAPTIKQIKPASIVTLTNEKRDLCNLWDINKEDLLQDLKLDYFKIREDERSSGIMIYNRDKLEDIIYKEESLEFLLQYGYNKDMNLNEVLFKLKERFSLACPHEIGLFLGYPIDDVKDFIDNNKKCLATGYWKVYNNLPYAKDQFKRFDIARIDVMTEIIKSNKGVKGYKN